MLQTSRVIVLQPVLEVYGFDDFTLWPVAKSAPYGFLPLSGALDPAEVGTAVMRISDTATGATLLPGCCNGLDERRDWLEVVDGTGWTSFGHDPSPLAERDGEVVRLTVDAEHDNSPVMEGPVTDLRRLLAGAEQDLIGPGWKRRVGSLRDSS
ncbi:hypothetical protein ACF07L_25100 [Streptomyces anulatus]|uniref:hypothetical protein n=1 Tax=Streptomyces anulatus TaxID=1892 RepID=UPI00370368E1